MGVIVPVVLVVVGLGAGVGAGLALRPSPPEVDLAETEETAESAETAEEELEEGAALSYVKINNQFVVPVIKDDRVSSLVVLSLSLEAPEADTTAIYDREPKIRDAFLQVLFDHAYVGGFDGVYTASANMKTLRSALLEVARNVAGDSISDVLITDIVRQDI